MREKKKVQRYLTTTQAARLAHISPSTLLRSIRTNKLIAFSTPGGHFRVDPDSLKAFLKKSGLENPERKKVTVVTMAPTEIDALLRDLRKDDGFAVVEEKRLSAAALKALPSGALHLLVPDAHRSGGAGSARRDLKKLVL